jgi:LacI family transcriptional regulator
MATILDVANAAGVSVATVSRAMQPDGPVRASTRELVLAVADRLGYQPNRAARGLVTGRTMNLGLVVPDLLNPFFAAIAKGTQLTARGRDLSVFTVDTDENPADEITAVRSLAKQVDGIVLCSPRIDDASLRRLQEEIQAPIVLVHRRMTGMNSVHASLDEGMQQAFEHLVGLGHEVIAHVGGPRASWLGDRRAAAIRAAAGRTGISVIDLGHVEPQFEGGIRAAESVRSSDATAVIAYNDIVAFGLVSRLAERGYSLPGDLSVIGCDDVSLSAMTNPRLTTIRLPKFDAGRVAVELLLEADHNEPREISLGSELIVRASTAAPRS